MSDSRFDSEPDTRADLRFDFPTDRPSEPHAPLGEEVSDPPGDTALDARLDAGFRSGLAVRRQVLGSSHVERAFAAADDFDRDFQEYITRSVWGEVWARPGLPLHTRHLLTLAMLAALGRQEELALHVRATRNTGVSRDEIKEVLLQVAVYAGVPAANAAIQTAKRAFLAEEAALDDE